MASVQEVLAINSRPGDSIKGGSQTYGITIDATPFARLAEFTYLDNVQKQKDKVVKDQEIALEMGKALSLDINTTNKEIYDELDKQKQEILYLLKNNKDVFDYNKNPEANKKYQELYGQFTANRTKATAFDVLNNAAVSQIAKLDTTEQQPAREVLENNRKISLVGGAKEFFKTGTQLETGLVSFKPEDFTVPKVGKISYTTVKIGGDNNMSREVNVIDVNAARTKSEQVWIGITTDEFIPEPNPKNDPIIELRNRNGAIQSKSKNAKKGRFSQQTLDKMNLVIEEYKQKKAEYDANPIGKPPTKTDQMIAIDAINQNILAANAALGQARANKQLNVPTFEIINYEDGLSGAELVLMETLASQPQEKFIEYADKATNTGIATTQRGQNMASATADKNRRVANVRTNKPPQNTFIDGNDFSAIGNHTYSDKKISGGYVIYNDNSLYTGPLAVPISKIPTSILNTIKQLDKEDGYKIQTEKGVDFVEFDVVDGKFQTVKTNKGIVTRKNQYAGQRRFDPRTKDEKETAFESDAQEWTP